MDTLGLVACFISGILSSFAGLAIGYVSRQRQTKALEKDLDIYSRSLESRDNYITEMEARLSKNTKAFEAIRKILDGVK